MSFRKDSERLPRIGEFPHGRWTIKALGEVKRNPEVPTEPIIDVLIESDQGTQEIIQLGVGQLPVLKVGTQWQDGTLSPYQDKQLEIFSLNDVLVDIQTVQYVQMYEQYTPNKYLIPPYVWKLSSKLRQAKCLAVEYDGNKYGIIIPLAEIARFYYCASTDLAQSAFLGEYRATHLNHVVNFEKCGFDEAKNRAIIHLRQRYQDNDAWTIARILNSDIALKGVRKIHNSLVARSINSEPAFFNCDIPFQGTTNWQARGVYIDDFDSPRYIVFQLLKCSHPFPFAELQVDRDNNANKANPGTDIATEDKKDYAYRQQGSPDMRVANKELNSQVETDKNSVVFNIEVPAEQFGYLEGKKIIKPEDKAFNEYKSMPTSIEANFADKLGTGQGDFSSRSTNQRAKINRKTGVGSDLDMLLEAVNLLRAQGIAINIRRKSELPLAEPERRWQWGYLDSQNKTRRLYVAVNITHNSRYFCWVEFEQRKKGERAVGLLIHADGIFITDGLLNEILSNLSRLKGVWEGEKGSAVEGTQVHFVKVKHTWDTAEKLSEIIKSRVEGSFSQPNSFD